MKSYRIWLSIAAILFIGKMFGTVWTQAEDLGGFDVSVSEGENWSLPDNWQENTSGWEEEADTKSTAESELPIIFSTERRMRSISAPPLPMTTPGREQWI